MGDVKPLLVVTGTRREGALVAGPGVTVLTGGGDAERLAQNLARLAPGACGIISFGTGGGLVPGQALGDMVIGSRVIGKTMIGAEPGDCDPAWVQALSRALPTAHIGSVYANGTLLASPAQKREAAATGAIIADMESHLAATAATAYHLPFAVLRCISDTAATALPPAIALAMRADGGLALGAVLASILRQPGQLPALIGVGAHFGRSFAALRAGAETCGNRLEFDRR